MELLVVIAIIGMLVGLLLPAVQQARESARQMQCSNNLKNLALACLNYESSAKTYPSNGWNWYWVGDPDRGGVKQTGGWTFSILPQLEQDALAKMGQDGQPDSVTTTQKNGALTCIQTPLAVFHCPSRRAAKVYPLGKHAPVNCAATTPGSTSSATQVAKGDYAINSGSLGFVGEYSPSSLSGFPNAARTSGLSGNSYNGISFARSAVKMGQVVDGTTNTYLIGEKYLCPTQYETGVSGGDNQAFYIGQDCDNNRWGATTSMYLPMQDRQGIDYVYNYGSPHAGTFGMSMCDGSVQRITYTIDGTVHSRLSSRADKKAAKLPE